MNMEDMSKFFDEPLYEGTQLTNGESIMAITSYVINHRPTDDALAGLLDLIRLHLPKGVDPPHLQSLSAFRVRTVL